MTPEERFDLISDILAAAYLRIRMDVIQKEMDEKFRSTKAGAQK